MSSDLNDIFDHLFDDMNKEKEQMPENEKTFIEENQEKFSQFSNYNDNDNENNNYEDNNNFTSNPVINRSSNNTTEEMELLSAEYKTDLLSRNFRRAISAAIINKREALGYDRKEFGKHVGMKSKTIFQIETMDYDFYIDELIELCHKLDINIDINISI